MDAPREGLSRDEFNAAIEGHISRHYKKAGKDFVCSADGAKILQADCAISVHLAMFNNHAGIGEVIHLPLPYCPTCEGEPKRTRTCIHV